MTSWNSALAAYSPTHWWKMDDASGNLADSGSGGETLTASSLSYRAVPAVGTGYSADFSSSGHATAGSALFGSGDMTVGGWFKIADGGDSNQRLAGQFVNASSRWLFSLREATGDIRIILDNTAVIDSAATGLNDDQWHFWAVVRDGNDWCIHIDGELSAGPTTQATTPPVAAFEIGLSVGAQDPNGLIDDVFIINGTALSNADLAHLNRFRPGIVSPAVRPIVRPCAYRAIA